LCPSSEQLASLGAKLTRLINLRLYFWKQAHRSLVNCSHSALNSINCYSTACASSNLSDWAEAVGKPHLPPVSSTNDCKAHFFPRRLKWINSQPDKSTPHMHAADIPFSCRTPLVLVARLFVNRFQKMVFYSYGNTRSRPYMLGRLALLRLGWRLMRATQFSIIERKGQATRHTRISRWA